MTLFFRPSVPLFYEFVQGRKDPYSTYLLCGPEATGMALGLYCITVNPLTKEIMFQSPFPAGLHHASHSFNCLSLYSCANPSLQVGLAETRPVERGEYFQLHLLEPETFFPYEEDLHKVISA